jgi:hypothetical protein
MIAWSEQHRPHLSFSRRKSKHHDTIHHYFDQSLTCSCLWHSHNSNDCYYIAIYQRCLCEALLFAGRASAAGSIGGAEGNVTSVDKTALLLSSPFRVILDVRRRTGSGSLAVRDIGVITSSCDALGACGATLASGIWLAWLGDGGLLVVSSRDVCVDTDAVPCRTQRNGLLSGSGMESGFMVYAPRARVGGPVLLLWR